MNNKRKNRPGLQRPPRGRVQTEGIYNNMYFMHAATSHVGNTVQVQTKSGAIFEGVFRTFSPQFQVILELAHKVENNKNEENNISVDSVVDKFIIKPSDIVTISAKDVDLEYPTRDTFQTDTAISSKCNGSLRSSSLRLEDRELEPWDGVNCLNGETELLELDGNANGWDANEMFSKNETVYGIQSTFDQSLSGYTMPIQKDTQDFKEKEAEAAKKAQEIESGSGYKERIELENGDEEQMFAAVERPAQEQNTIEPQTNVPKNNPGKYMSQIKRKANINPNNKILLRPVQPMNNNGNHSGPPQIQQQQQNSQVSIKNNNYQTMTMPPPQQNISQPPQYVHTQPSFSHIHSQPPPNISVSNKMNGENNNNSHNNKALPPRMRQYQPTTTPVSYTEPPPTLAPQHMIQKQITTMPAMGKPPIHIQNTGHVVNQHITATVVPEVSASPQQQPVHVVVPAQHHVQVVQPTHVVVQTNQPPPQPQRIPRTREEQDNSLRKFNANFNLQQPSGGPSPPQQQNQPPPQNVHQHVHQQQQQQPSQQQQQQQMLQENIETPPTTKSQQQNEQNNSPNLNQQQSQSVLVGNGSNNGNSGSTNSTPPQTVNNNNSNNNNSSSSSNSTNNSGSNSSESTPSEKAGVGAKKFVLNPAAKPFTPRSPSTPNPSRPHTPQTPGPSSLTQQPQPGPYQTGSNHVVAAAAAAAVAQQPQMMVPYSIVHQQPFQAAPPHPHPGQPTRFRKMQIQSVTGQPLLAPSIQQFMPFPQAPHPQHFQSQPYQQMQVRMFHDSPPQPQLQYLTPTPPSTTPSPGQPHQQYHPGPQPSPAGGGPQAYAPAAPQAPQFQMFPILPGHPQLVPQYFQGAVPQHNHPQHIQVIMPQHPAQ